MNMFNLKRLFLFACALLCATGYTTAIFNFAGVSAQTKRAGMIKQKTTNASAMTATLTDSFADPDSDGKAQRGSEITYTATVTNNDSINSMTNVNFTNPIDANTTLVEGSVQVQHNLNVFAVRCAFSTAGSGSVDCSTPSQAYGVTDADNYTILGGQGKNVNVTATNAGYDPSTGIFQFDATVQNLLEQSIGSIDNVTLEQTGVQLFVENAVVKVGEGNLSAANADGAGTFSAPDQPYFQYNQILAKDEVSNAKTLQFNIPNTVDSFAVDFLVSTKVSAKLVINEVLANPGGTISDASGEWFELYNAGLFPVNMKSFYIGDSAASGDRPLHLISADATIQPKGYLVFGNTTNTTNNGGVSVDYAYGSAMALANSLDAVRVLSPYSRPTTTGDLGYFIELDRVRYNSAAVSAQNGISREVRDVSLNNFEMDDQAVWQDASVNTVYGPGGRGTPGAPNTTAVETPLANTDAMACAVIQKRINAPNMVTASVGTLAPGQSATITYRVKIADTLPMGTTEIMGQGMVTDDQCTTAMTDDPATDTFEDATMTPVAFAPTATPVTVSGRVTTASGRGIRNVSITMTDSNGNERTAQTTAFGYYRFDGVTAGETVVIRTKAKRYSFIQSSIVRSTNDQISDADFVSEQ